MDVNINQKISELLNSTNHQELGIRLALSNGWSMFNILRDVLLSSKGWSQSDTLINDFGYSTKEFCGYYFKISIHSYGIDGTIQNGELYVNPYQYLILRFYNSELDLYNFNSRNIGYNHYVEVPYVIQFKLLRVMLDELINEIKQKLEI